MFIFRNLRSHPSVSANTTVTELNKDFIGLRMKESRWKRLSFIINRCSVERRNLSEKYFCFLLENDLDFSSSRMCFFCGAFFFGSIIAEREKIRRLGTSRDKI